MRWIIKIIVEILAYLGIMNGMKRTKTKTVSAATFNPALKGWHSPSPYDLSNPNHPAQSQVKRTKNPSPYDLSIPRRTK